MPSKNPPQSRVTRRERLRRLVEALPDTELPTAVRVLEALNAAAEYDTEPLTLEEEVAEQAAWRDYQEGRDPGVPLAEVKRRALPPPEHLPGHFPI